MFNIKKLAIASQATMPVKDPKGAVALGENDTPLGITLHSPGTKKFQKAKHAHDEIINQQAVKRMRGEAVKEGEAEEARAAFLADVTISFDNFDYEGKKGPDAFKAAYLDPEIDLAEQANRFLGDRGNFFVGLPKASSSTSVTSPG